MRQARSTTCGRRATLTAVSGDTEHVRRVCPARHAPVRAGRRATRRATLSRDRADARGRRSHGRQCTATARDDYSCDEGRLRTPRPSTKLPASCATVHVHADDAGASDSSRNAGGEYADARQHHQQATDLRADRAGSLVGQSAPRTRCCRTSASTRRRRPRQVHPQRAREHYRTSRAPGAAKAIALHSRTATGARSGVARSRSTTERVGPSAGITSWTPD